MLEMTSSILSSVNAEWINKICTQFLEIALVRIKEKALSEDEYVELLIIIADLMPYMDENGNWDEICYEISKHIMNNIADKEINPWSTGMYYQLGKPAFAIDLYQKRSGHMKKLAQSLAKALLQAGAQKARYLIEHAERGTYISEYDLLSGISGVLNFCLEQPVNDYNRSYLVDMASYLKYMAGNKEWKGKPMIRYHIPAAHLSTDIERHFFPQGNINLSLSHGLMGPYIALSKAASMGVCKADHELAAIHNIYRSFERIQSGVSRWPCYISPKNYYDIRMPKLMGLFYFQTTSWCYGNISILRGLQQIAASNANEEVNNTYIKKLIDIIDQSVDDYHFVSPELCHGYASILAVGSYLYHDCKNERIIESLERTVNAIKDLFHNMNIEQILERYYNNSFSILQGMGGTVLALANMMDTDLEFGGLLMIK